jgi:dUTP pyrophosphatase
MNYDFHFGNIPQEKQRGFEIVPHEYRKHPEVDIILPTRGDDRSAGYDFYLPQPVLITPGNKITIWTDVCSYMQPDEVLMLYVRSSIGIKKGLVLANGTGIIDSSYYPNNIGICLYNSSDEKVNLLRGDRIAQGIFMKYLTADNDEVLNKSRKGGFGSSGR